ncbi:hypothetical protein LTR53_014157 [Teratosphaeriaceae sp. CCFEE 6253]|nr:hypothetical protein LTR53_014157 [Teratosphaeriaceae sp. CCFEE 6253]
MELPGSTWIVEHVEVAHEANREGRKAAPLPQSPHDGGLSTSPHRSSELHSPLSPLSPGSPIHPDGVFTPLWLAKHGQHVPALLVAFFDISADEDSAQNEQIQIDINAIRTALGRSGFKTRFAAVLMSDVGILRAPQLEDRLIAIRRATTLDTKTGLFFMPPMSSQAEIATFVQSMLAALQPSVVEYYRDLTKHSRRKKIRSGAVGSITSPVDGGAHALSTPGWNTRYEVKQGVFAEFRQEMHVAERHYSAAIEELFSSEGMLEVIPSWSPRWDEARLLCDVVAFRVLRCELWSGLTTSAAVSWTNYKARMRDLVDRRGKGSQTYSWDAWETRWAETMAQLILRAAVPSLQPSIRQATEESMEFAVAAPYAASEKSSIASDRLPPFQLLHHPGYWLRLAAHSARARRLKALAIPEEARIAPAQLPASAVAQRAKSYDTFLVPDPHEECPLADGKPFDHIAEITRLTYEAIRQFAVRSQGRATDRLNLELAQQLAAAGRYELALERLQPIWDDCTWRDDDWDDLLAPMFTLLHECAGRCGKTEIHIATAWELLSLDPIPSIHNSLSFPDYIKRSWPQLQSTAVRFKNRERLSPLSARFVFATAESYVGDRIICQLALISHAAQHDVPLNLTNALIVLSNTKMVTLRHRSAADLPSGNDVLFDLSETVEQSDGNLMLETDLSLPRGLKRLFTFSLGLREAGAIRLQQLSLQLGDGHFSVEHTYTDTTLVCGSAMYLQNGDMLVEESLPYPETTVLTIHPKPPKMQMDLRGLRQQYYVGEIITLQIKLLNDEIEAIEACAEVSATHAAEELIEVHWDGSDTNSRDLNVGRLETSATRTLTFHMAALLAPTACTLTIKINYTLSSDSHPPLSKTMDVEAVIVAPFEAKHSFEPIHSPEPWPSYFATYTEVGEEHPEGIPQQWQVGSTLRSTATDALQIRGFRLTQRSDNSDTVCSLQASPVFEQSILELQQTLQIESEFVTRKRSFDDRRPTEVALTLEVDWSRDADSDIITARLDIPPATLPSSEPRVLCTVAEPRLDEHELNLQYHIENSSGHFLTFAVTMEANEDFAFSGAKLRTLSVAPLSRVSVSYRLLVHDPKGDPAHAKERWVSPALQVVDSYYNKALRIHSGGPRVKIDEKGVLNVLFGGLQD